uniref:Uncharacterized protein n=1 Tax=Rhizophora mucronata TaxID=61149 RepID=A0A2P2P0W3_RHIMU
MYGPSWILDELGLNCEYFHHLWFVGELIHCLKVCAHPHQNFGQLVLGETGMKLFHQSCVLHLMTWAAAGDLTVSNCFPNWYACFAQNRASPKLQEQKAGEDQKE